MWKRGTWGWTNMEAFFSSDHEIQEWIDLFIEKLFTVSLLSGNDADSEFYQGQQAIEKIALFFQEMLELPEETIRDGIRQLVEQRLPDSRVIENFPNFYQLMNDMIRAGLQCPLAIPAMQTAAHINPLPILSNSSSPELIIPQAPVPSSKVVLNGGWIPKSCPQDSTPIDVTLRQNLLNPIDCIINPTESIDSNSAGEDLLIQESKEQETRVNPLLSLEILKNGISLQTKTLTIQEAKDSKNLQQSGAIERDSDSLIIETNLVFEQNIPPTIDIDVNNKPSLAPENPLLALHDVTLEKEEPSSSTTFTAKASTPTRRDPFRFYPKRSDSARIPNPITPVQPKNEDLTKYHPAKSENASIKATQDQNNAPSKKLRDIRTGQIPQEANRLAQVLIRFFPKNAIHWNTVIGKNTFYAQVAKVLVYIQETDSIQEIEHIRHLETNMKKEGWIVFICLKEDLRFPRRLERGLRAAMRQ